MSEMKQQIMLTKSGSTMTGGPSHESSGGVTGPQVSEGLLGRVPENTESLAEIMLFDSDINVYGDSNVYIPEFDFKNRVTKAIQKGKKAQKSDL
jgi:hypothetical protein